MNWFSRGNSLHKLSHFIKLKKKSQRQFHLLQRALRTVLKEEKNYKLPEPMFLEAKTDQEKNPID